MMSPYALTLIILSTCCCCRCSGVAIKKGIPGEESVLDKFKSGIQMAGKILGLDAASGVAQLVSNAFNQRANENDDDASSNGVFARVLKMLSLDVSKIGAVVVNAIIFLAQLISTSLGAKSPALTDATVTPRKIRDGSPIDWIMENRSERFLSLLEATKDENLTGKVIEAIREQSGKDDTVCVQLLICRITPFVKSMQRALAERDNDSKPRSGRGGMSKNVLFRYLPEFKEFDEHGDECKRRHEECRLLD